MQLAETDIRLLRVFWVVANKGGFTAAELTLGKSKSAISADISALETRLGLKLCQRGRSGFELTPEGAKIYEAVGALLDHLDQFRDRVNQAKGHLSGTFSLYVTDNIVTNSASRIIEALAVFTRHYPEVFIDLVSAPADVIEQAVLDGRARLGISGMPRLEPTLDLQPLFKEQLHLYCGNLHPLFNVPDSAITPETLADHKVIAVSAGVTGPQWPVWLEKLRFAARAGSIDARTILLLTGEYLGFLPHEYAEPWVRDGRLRALAPDRLVLGNIFYLMAKRGAPASQIAKQFSSVLNEQFLTKE